MHIVNIHRSKFCMKKIKVCMYWDEGVHLHFFPKKMTNKSIDFDFFFFEAATGACEQVSIVNS